MLAGSKTLWPFIKTGCHATKLWLDNHCGSSIKNEFLEAPSGQLYRVNDYKFMRQRHKTLTMTTVTFLASLSSLFHVFSPSHFIIISPYQLTQLSLQLCKLISRVPLSKFSTSLLWHHFNNSQPASLAIYFHYLGGSGHT